MVIIYLIEQSADNQIQFERLRDYTLVIASTNLIGKITNSFEISPIKVKTPEGISKNNQLGPYLAGLIEGDGHILLPFLNKSGKIEDSPKFEITFHINNHPLALKLMNVLNCGKVRLLNTQNACRLVISGPQELIKIVTLVNGHFRTPKIEALNQLINWLNTNKNCSIEKFSINTSSLLDNAWFAGFSDADSNFYVRISEKTINIVTGTFSKARVVCRYALEQRKIEPKFGGLTEPFIQQIADTFHVSLLTSKHNKPPLEYWCIHVRSKKGVKEIINYFEKFPLIGSKYLDYSNFKSVYKLIEQKNHFTESGVLEASLNKKQINNARTKYTWDHLINFYN